MKVTGTIAALGSVALLVVVAFPTTVCGCTSDGEMFGWKLGIYPMSAGPDASRAAFLSKVPQGSPMSNIHEFLGNNFGKHCRERPARITCEFDLVAGFFGQLRSGYQFEIRLDGSRSVEDVRFDIYKRSWFRNAV